MISDFTQDFQSSRRVQNVLKTQHKYNIDEISITTLYWEAICGLKLAQTHCTLLHYFASCWVFTLCWAETHKY